jgi:hypothetical protein
MIAMGHSDCRKRVVPRRERAESPEARLLDAVTSRPLIDDNKTQR